MLSAHVYWGSRIYRKPMTYVYIEGPNSSTYDPGHNLSYMAGPDRPIWTDQIWGVNL